MKKSTCFQVRIPCQYDALSPGRLGQHITLPHGAPDGCAAGSVLRSAGPDAAAAIYADNPFHRTAEYRSSVWRKASFYRPVYLFFCLHTFPQPLPSSLFARSLVCPCQGVMLRFFSPSCASRSQYLALLTYPSTCRSMAAT
jgi:hypothetical protein